MTWPDFFIVGAPKSGTTSLAHYLDEHPDVFVPTSTEPHYYDRYRDPDGEFTVSDANEYEALFEGAGKAERVGEKSVWYLRSPTSAKLIREDVPDADVIVMLRNPIEMVPSMHAQNLSNGDEDLQDLGDALDAEPHRRKGEQVPDNAPVPHGLFYREIGSYADQVRRYLDNFPEDQVRVLLFDDFVDDVEQAYRDTVGFLGQDPSFVPDLENVNPRTEPRWFGLHRFLWNPPDVLERTVKAVVPKSIRRPITNKARRANLHRANSQDPKPDVRNRLREMFRADIRDLEDVIGRDLSPWLETE